MRDLDPSRGASNDPFPRVVLSTLWLTQSAGGMTNTIGKFKQALDADVVSFTDPRKLRSEGTGVTGAIHVPHSDTWWGRTYSWAPLTSRTEADRLASNAQLFSCHSILRYHVNWMLSQVKAKPRPYWFVPHGVLDPWVFTYHRFSKRLWMSLLGDRFMRDASRVIFATEREKAKARHIYSGDRGVVVPWPVSPIDLVDRPGLRHHCRCRLGIPENAKVILYLGRIHSLKRPLETIAAVAATRVPDLHLVMVGPPDDVTARDCERRASSSNFSNLHLAGPAFGLDKLQYYAAADALILLSHRENFGHVVAEAVSCGLPIIASHGIDLNEVFQPLGCGWFVDINDRAQVDQALRDFCRCSDHALRSMTAQASGWVRRELSMDKFTARIRAIAIDTVSEYAQAHA